MYTDSQAKTVRNNFQGGSILIVEDNDDQWLLIRHGLKIILPEVRLIWIATTQEASSYLQDLASKHLALPRLVLLDLYLPMREDGFEFLKTVKTSTSVLRRIPVVVLSNSSHLDDISHAYELGASSYFTKPTQPAEWEAYFQAFLGYWGQTVTLPSNYAR